MDLLLKFVRLEWWVYVIVVVTLFTVALFLNYVLKKVNGKESKYLSFYFFDR